MSAAFPELPTVTMLMESSDGVTGAEFDDGRLMPTEFRAMTLITYAVPLARPVTVHGDAVMTVVLPHRVHDPATPLLLEYFTR